MSSLLKTLACLSVLILIVSCSSSWESKGNAAYGAAKRASTEDQKRLDQKTAYVMYQKAIKAHPNRISKKLRERFIEMCLLRANMVLSEGSTEYDALPLLLDDVDKYWSAEDAAPDVKKSYADLLMKIADSTIAAEKIIGGLKKIDKAISLVDEKAPYEQRKAAIITSIVKNKYELAKADYEEAIKDKKNKDVEALIRAEYNIKVAMALDSSNQDAQKLLSNILQENVNTYSAFVRVIENKPDSALYKRVNKWDILFAIPGRGTTSYVVKMYNYSYNPLRLFANQFALVDESGKADTALSSSKIEPEILDQEHETELKLVFHGTVKKPKKLTYKNAEHYSEKLFY